MRYADGHCPCPCGGWFLNSHDAYFVLLRLQILRLWFCTTPQKKIRIYRLRINSGVGPGPGVYKIVYRVPVKAAAYANGITRFTTNVCNKSAPVDPGHGVVTCAFEKSHTRFESIRTHTQVIWSSSNIHQFESTTTTHQQRGKKIKRREQRKKQLGDETFAGSDSTSCVCRAFEFFI